MRPGANAIYDIPLSIHTNASQLVNAIDQSCNQTSMVGKLLGIIPLIGGQNRNGLVCV